MTEQYQVELKTYGSSGKFEITNGQTSINIRQLKIEEYEPDGTGTEFKIVGGQIWNLAGSGDFFEMVTNPNGTKTVLYEAFDNKFGNFFLGVTVGHESETKEIQDELSQETVSVQPKSLKFSVKIEGWPFQSPQNQLRYGLVVDSSTFVDGVPQQVQNETTTADTIVVKSSAGKVAFPKSYFVTKDGGSLGPVKEQRALGSVVPGSGGNEPTLTLVFQAEENLTSIVYDPDIILQADLPEEEKVQQEQKTEQSVSDSDSSSSAWVWGLLAVGLVVLIIVVWAVWFRKKKGKNEVNPEIETN